MSGISDGDLVEQRRSAGHTETLFQRVRNSNVWLLCLVGPSLVVICLDYNVILLVLSLLFGWHTIFCLLWLVIFLDITCIWSNITIYYLHQIMSVKIFLKAY